MEHHIPKEKKKAFKGESFQLTDIEKCFEFAYEMCFGSGHHRNHRSGGDFTRNEKEQFANTFQGKLGEIAFSYELIHNGITEFSAIDFNVYGKGIWDDSDFIINEKKISIKTCPSFGNLFLLECKDWNDNGEYIPNINNGNSHYDYHILIRISPDLKGKLKEFNTREELKEYVLKQTFLYDIPGCCSINTLKHIIKLNRIINKGVLLNGKIPMDADNYYIYANELKSLNLLYEQLK